MPEATAALVFASAASAARFGAVLLRGARRLAARHTAGIVAGVDATPEAAFQGASGAPR